MPILLGINIVSLAYLSPGISHLFATPSQLIKLAKEIGFDFVMALPLRGATGREEPVEYIRYGEDAWNPGTVWDLIFNRPSLAGPRRLHDILLFPAPSSCRRLADHWYNRGVQKIGHNFSRAKLVEVSPLLVMSQQEILDYSNQTESQLVIDTHHLQQTSSIGTTLEDWGSAIALWETRLANVIHFNVDANAFLSGDETNALAILDSWLGHTRWHKNRFIVLEYRPRLNPFANRNLAGEMIKRIRQLYFLTSQTPRKTLSCGGFPRFRAII